uniref:Uncharacterized protein n=1 Tax=Timema poppense TaxID=170557 RepID=A0A7R9D9B6_TIMPO|nr:unnamed protein product [Timema poppensis]
MDDRRVDVLGLSETKWSGSVVRIVRNGFILHWMVEDEGSLNRVVFIMREEGLQVEMMEGDIRSSSSEVSDEPSGYDPTGTNSLQVRDEIVSHCAPPLTVSLYPTSYISKYGKVF